MVPGQIVWYKERDKERRVLLREALYLRIHGACDPHQRGSVFGQTTALSSSSVRVGVLFFMPLRDVPDDLLLLLSC